MENNVTIDDWRRQIDKIDAQLIELLNHRAQCSVEIGKLKQQMNLSIAAPEREEEVISQAIQRNHGPLEADAVGRLFTTILEESRRLQEEAGKKEPISDESLMELDKS